MGSRKKKLDEKYGPCAAIEILKFHENFKKSDFPPNMPSGLKVLYMEAFKAGYVVSRTSPWLKAVG